MSYEFIKNSRIFFYINTEEYEIMIKEIINSMFLQGNILIRFLSIYRFSILLIHTISSIILILKFIY